MICKSVDPGPLINLPFGGALIGHWFSRVTLTPEDAVKIVGMKDIEAAHYIKAVAMKIRAGKFKA